jgi:hypothetical protein
MSSKIVASTLPMGRGYEQINAIIEARSSDMVWFDTNPLPGPRSLIRGRLHDDVLMPSALTVHLNKQCLVVDD